MKSILLISNSVDLYHSHTSTVSKQRWFAHQASGFGLCGARGRRIRDERFQEPPNYSKYNSTGRGIDLITKSRTGLPSSVTLWSRKKFLDQLGHPCHSSYNSDMK